MTDAAERTWKSAVKIVHVLRFGTALCGTMPGVPRDWPERHARVSPLQLGLVRPELRCPSCWKVLEER